MSKYKVLIDTNIYDELNYSFGNPQFTAIKQYVNKGYLSLLMTSVIRGEVEKHIKDRITKTANYLNKAFKECSRDLASFRYDEPYKSKVEKYDKKDMIALCTERFYEYLSVCQTEFISSNNIDIEQMINDYINKNFPFEEAKPNEFKDAIIIRSFINYYLENNNNEEIFCVLSSDKGFCNGIERLLPEGHNILLFNDINELIKVISNFDMRIQALSKFIELKYCDDDIKDKIETFIEDANYHIDDPIDELEVTDIDNIMYKLLWIDILDENTAQATFEVEAEIDIWYSYIDEDNSFYDKEDQCYLWKNEIKKDEAHKIKFELTVVIDLSNFGLHSNAIEDEDNDFDDDYIEITDVSYEPLNIDLDETTCVRSVVTDSGAYHENDNYRDYAYTTCPDCGTYIGLENDGGNGFCINCAYKH